MGFFKLIGTYAHGFFHYYCQKSATWAQSPAFIYASTVTSWIDEATVPLHPTSPKAPKKEAQPEEQEIKYPKVQDPEREHAQLHTFYCRRNTCYIYDRY